MSTETQRAEFEAFVLDQTGRDVEYHGRAGTVGLAFAYLCWQAAQASQAAEIEALRKDAELWKHWRPWLERRVGDLSKYNAAMQTKEAS